MRRVVMVGAIASVLATTVACARDAAQRDVPPVADVAPRPLARTDGRVDPAAQAACAFGDSLLRRLGPDSVRAVPAIRFDSVWHTDTSRWACQVVANAHTKRSKLSVEAVVAALTERGWDSRVAISADGPDGTVLGMMRGGVTCVLEGRWDGGDDSDTTYVPSDDIEVRIACTRSAAGDAMPPEPAPSAMPATPQPFTIIRKADPRRP